MNVGFIGTGWTERVQIQVYQKAGLHPYGIASGNYENALRVQRNFGLTKAYQHWQELVIDPNIDIISIVTPTHLHYKMLHYAIQNKKRVICQAPFMNYKEIQKLVVVAEKYSHKKSVFIDFELRFVPVIQKLKQLIQSGVAGQIHWIELEYRHNFGLDKATPYGWENDLAKGGGVLNTIADHFIDLSQWLLNDQIIQVLGNSLIVVDERTDSSHTKHNVTGDQQVNLWCKFNNHIQGRVLVTSVSAFQGIDIIIHGSQGSFHLKDSVLQSNIGDDFPNKRWKTVEVQDDAQQALGDDLSSYLFADGSYHFAKNLAQNTAKLSNAVLIHEAVQVQKVLDQAQASILEKKWKDISINQPMIV